jgi:lysophospholipase L1-like esterase
MIRTAAVAVGALGGLTSAAYGLLSEQSKHARQVIGVPKEPPFNADGVYLPGAAAPTIVEDPADLLRFAVIGDSSAAGLGVDNPLQLPGVLLARGLAEESGRPVRLLTWAVSGATTRDLPGQVDGALTDPPDVVLVIVGANDVTDRLLVRTSADLLAEQISRLRAAKVAVVVGTCPDLGAIQPIPQPLRTLARTWSLLLARAQRVAVQRAGGVPVALADLLSPEFFARPAELFSKDRFHPNAAGYEAAAAVLLAPLCAAAGIWDGVADERVPAVTVRPTGQPGPLRRTLPTLPGNGSVGLATPSW